MLPNARRPRRPCAGAKSAIAAAENANDLIFTHDLAGNFTSINRTAEQVVGYPRAEACTRNVRDLIVPEHMPVAVQAITRQLAGEAVPPYPLDIITKDGRRISVEVHSRILYAGGKPVAVQGIARDITDRKRAEEAVAERVRLAALAAAVGTALTRSGSLTRDPAPVRRGDR